jgi:hypothetical protein
VDYALLSLLQHKQENISESRKLRYKPHYSLSLKKSLEINVLLEQTSLDQLVDTIPSAICLSQDLLATTLMEEKSEENSGRSLHDSRPQMYGECVAL